MMLFLLLLGAGAFPSGSPTAWMDPAAFHLRMGMSRSAASAELRQIGVKPRAGKQANHLLIEYAENKTITLAFEANRLQSVRFELADYMVKIPGAYETARSRLETRNGKPSTKTATMSLWNDQAIQSMVVMSTDPRSRFGKQGLGFVVVRYFTTAK